MHPDEIDIDESPVRKLVATQFPNWADRRLKFLPNSGTDHVTVRLGDDLVVRLPRHERASGQVAIEYRWLPKLAPSSRFPSRIRWLRDSRIGASPGRG